MLAAAAAAHPSHSLFEIYGLPVTSEVTTEWVLMGVILLLAVFATRRLSLVPGKFQAAVELGVNFVVDTVIAPSIGGREKAIRYLPFLGSLFFFILLSNYLGLLPGAVLELPGYKAPTANVSVTAALAILAFVATHLSGFRERGIRYLGHFFQPFWFLFPLNLVEELIRPLSLSLRLFGNIFGEEYILLVLLGFAPWFVPVPIMGLDLLFGFLQAFIFTTLTAAYIGGAIAEHH